MIPHTVFLSCSPPDHPAIEAVCQRFEQNGLGYWIASKDRTQSSTPSAAALAEIDECKVFVLVLSSGVNSSDQALQELAAARRSGKPVVCLRIEDWHATGALADSISGLPCIDAVNVPPDEAARTLVENIQKAIDLQESDKDRSAAGAAPAAPAPSSSVQARPRRRPRRTDYDVFISYRRETDSQTARLIQAELLRHRFRAFLDVDDLRPGHFDEALLEQVQRAPNFVVILSPGSLDQCGDPDDWLRKEVGCALAEKKTVIPIMMPGFTFPPQERLPVELRPLRTHQGVTYSHEFFKAMIEKLVSYLAKPRELAGDRKIAEPGYDVPPAADLAAAMGVPLPSAQTVLPRGGPAAGQDQPVPQEEGRAAALPTLAVGRVMPAAVSASAARPATAEQRPGGWRKALVGGLIAVAMLAIGGLLLWAISHLSAVRQGPLEEATRQVIASATAADRATPWATATRYEVPAVSATAAIVGTLTPSRTATASLTPSRTPTPSATATRTATRAPSSTATRTATRTPGATRTRTPTPPPTATEPPPPTATQPPPPTATHPPPPTATQPLPPTATQPPPTRTPRPP